MQGILVRKESGCFSAKHTTIFARLDNYELKFYKEKEHVTIIDNVDMRVLTLLSFNPKSHSFKVHTSDNEYVFVSSKEFRSWRNTLEVFKNCKKPWHPIPMPDVYHKGLIWCLNYIQEHGVHEKGIFRRVGDKVQIDEMFSHFLADSGSMTSEKSRSNRPSLHTVAGCIKKLLDTMPETLLTNKFYSLLSENKKNISNELIEKGIEECETINIEVIRLLAKVSGEIVSNQKETEMGVKNMATCISGNLRRKDRGALDHLTVNIWAVFVYCDKRLVKPDDVPTKTRLKTKMSSPIPLDHSSYFETKTKNPAEIPPKISDSEVPPVGERIGQSLPPKVGGLPPKKSNPGLPSTVARVGQSLPPKVGGSTLPPKKPGKTSRNTTTGGNTARNTTTTTTTTTNTIG